MPDGIGRACARPLHARGAEDRGGLQHERPVPSGLHKACRRTAVHQGVLGSSGAVLALPPDWRGGWPLSAAP